ncbi:hypothetical protein D3C75_695360 [compost metagenome]
MHLAQVSGAELDVLVRVEQLLWRAIGNAELACGFLGGGGHQLHQARGADPGAGIFHEGAFLASDGKRPARMQAAILRFTHQRVAVGHRETDIQIVPVLRLADGANGREVPFQVVGQFGLGDHFVAAEVTADVVPLAAPVDDLPASVELQGATYAGGVAHFVDQRLAHHQRLVVQRIG